MTDINDNTAVFSQRDEMFQAGNPEFSAEVGRDRRAGRVQSGRGSRDDVTSPTPVKDVETPAEPVPVATPEAAPVATPAPVLEPQPFLGGSAFSPTVEKISVKFYMPNENGTGYDSYEVDMPKAQEGSIKLDLGWLDAYSQLVNDTGVFTVTVHQTNAPDLQLTVRIDENGTASVTNANLAAAIERVNKDGVVEQSVMLSDGYDSQSWDASETDIQVIDGQISVNLTQAGVERLQRRGGGELVSGGADGAPDQFVADRLLAGTVTAADWDDMESRQGDSDTQIQADMSSSAKDFMLIASQYQTASLTTPLGSDSSELSADITNYMSQQVGNLKNLAQAEQFILKAIADGIEAGWSPEVTERHILKAFNAGGFSFGSIEEVADFIDKAKTNIMESTAAVMSNAAERLKGVQDAEERAQIMETIGMVVSIGIAVGGSMGLISAGLSAVKTASTGLDTFNFATSSVFASNLFLATGSKIYDTKAASSSTGQTYAELGNTIDLLETDPSLVDPSVLTGGSPGTETTPAYQEAQRNLYVAFMDFVNPGGGKEEIALPEQVFQNTVWESENAATSGAGVQAQGKHFVSVDPDKDQYIYSYNYDAVSKPAGVGRAREYGTELTMTRMNVGDLFVGMDRNHNDLGRHAGY